MLALCLAPSAARADQVHSHAAGDPQRLGTIDFPNSCSRAVQHDLGRAIAMMHSFWYAEARRQFRAVADQDPRCGIAWWGVAMTYWQPLWEPRGPDREQLRRGQDAIRRARAIGAGTQRERDFIAALARFYTRVESTDHLDRVLAYEQAMERLHRRYPADTEARVFYALSLLGSATSLPPDKTYARQKRAGALLEPVFARRPDHPGVAHYIIHAYDYPELAPRALAAARRYAAIAPDSPHALHMPSHVFTRLGLWDESIASNRRVIEVARRLGEVGEQLHGTDYLVFALLQKGEDREALAVMRQMPEARPGGMLYFAGIFAHAAIPARYAIERRQWAEAANLTVPSNFPGGRYAWADATIHFARALGAARTGDVRQARAEVEKLDELRRTLERLREDYWATQVEIQRREAAAWLAFAEGKRDEALAMMRSAARLEDSTDKHPVTPGWIVPAHDLLGQMLLEVEQPRAAGAEFQKVLAAEPRRFGALYGAARSAELAGNLGRARVLYTQLVKLAPSSDRREVQHARRVLGQRGPANRVARGART